MNKRMVGLIAKHNAKETSIATKKKLTKIINNKGSGAMSSWIEREIDDKVQNGKNFSYYQDPYLSPM